MANMKQGRNSEGAVKGASKDARTSSKSRLSSNSLFHFTSKLHVLKEILSSKHILVSYCTEYFWNGYKFALPMACFCDIPLTMAGEHMSKYGYYGIGFKPTWENAKKLSSAIYTKRDSQLYKYIENKIAFKYNGETKGLNPSDLYLLSHIKKYRGRFIHKDMKEKHNITFYDEREWRYVPRDLSDVLIKVEKNNNEPIAVQYTPKTLDFDYDDISYIIVKEEHELEFLIKYIESKKMTTKKDIDKKLLMTKLITAKQIENDF